MARFRRVRSSGPYAGEGFAGDFGTPEQEVPREALPGVDWESCITLNDHWGFNAADTHWKSARELVRTLTEVASRGGNLLLNVGPTAQGEIPGPCIERLREVGRWMRVNGESIYGTSAGPLTDLAWGTCTARAGATSTTLYLHVHEWPAGGALVVPG